jgi:hypothetical protein
MDQLKLTEGCACEKYIQLLVLYAERRNVRFAAACRIVENEAGVVRNLLNWRIQSTGVVKIKQRKWEHFTDLKCKTKYSIKMSKPYYVLCSELSPNVESSTANMMFSWCSESLNSEPNRVCYYVFVLKILNVGL